MNVTVSGQIPDGLLKPSYPSLPQIWPPDNATSPEYSFKVRVLAEGHFVLGFQDLVGSDLKGDFLLQDLGNNTDFPSLGVRFQVADDQLDYPDDRLDVKVWQESDNVTRKVLDLSCGSVIMTSLYSEFSMLLESSVIFGLGGHDLSFNFTGWKNGSDFSKKLIYNQGWCKIGGFFLKKITKKVFNSQFFGPI